MKNLKKIFAIAMCVLLSSSSAFALNDIERAAQLSMKEFLRSKGISSSIDPKDNSLNFLRKDSKGHEIIYWITFDGNATCMLFNLHRKSIKMISEKDDKQKASRKLENARLASEYVTAANDYKAFVNGNKVEFQFPVYAASVADYQKVFMKILGAFNGVQQSYDNCYRKAKAYNDSVHMFWQKNDTSKLVVRQAVRNDEKATKNLMISNIQIRNVDNEGNEIPGWEKGLRGSKAKYLQPVVTLASTKKGTYKVGVKIITPKGKTLVPTRESVFSTITTIEVPKDNKAADYELLKFGVNNSDFWDAGEYKIIFYEDDRQIFDDTFTIL